MLPHLIVFLILVVKCSKAECPDSFFQCHNGGCINQTDVCNDVNDCRDGSDEIDCKNGIIGQAYTCSNTTDFQCMNKRCVSLNNFCNGRNDCGDHSDETYCNYQTKYGCPEEWMPCKSGVRCIPNYYRCRGFKVCPDKSDDQFCGNDIEMVDGAHAAKLNLTSWILRSRKNDSSLSRWGANVHRTAVALFLTNSSFFSPNNATGREITYELTIRLLSRLSQDSKVTAQELALYVQALLVTCGDPKNFEGRNLVQDLRALVDEDGSYTNPLNILALCNAKADMTTKDVDLAVNAFSAQKRSLWTDVQALSAMALSCLSSIEALNVDKTKLTSMFNKLKENQQRNGLVDNLKTTGLVIQALLYDQSYKNGFDIDAAVRALVEGQSPDGSYGSLLDAYYILPSLSYKSFLSISSSHCIKTPDTDDETLREILDEKNGVPVQYSIWIGNGTDITRTWRVRMLPDKTVTDLLETIQKIDSRHRVKYDTVKGKRYVRSLVGIEDDAEMGRYWFLYTKDVDATAPTLIDQSPDDVKVQANQEVIYWYKEGEWV